MINRLLGALCATVAFSSAALADPVSVKMSYIVDHPAINAARDGVVAALAEGGFVDGTTMALEVQSAQGAMPTQVQINQKFVGDDPDLILAISTPSAQTAMAATSRIPIVFSAVTDPLAAGLVDSNDAPGRNLSGSSDLTPIDLHLALIQRILPDARRLGVIYNSGEANSVAQIVVLRAEAEAAGLELVEASALQTSGVLDAARSLIGKVDAIYIPTDSTVVSAAEAVVKVGQDAKIPVFAGDTSVVPRGAVAALGFDYFDIGHAAGEIAVAVLNGADISTLPVRFVDEFDLVVNPASSEKMGLTLPADILAEAVEIVE